MIQSQYIKDILQLLLDGDEEGVALKKQIDFLSDINYDYTGFGVFVTFLSSQEISNYKIATNSSFLDGELISDRLN